MIEPIGWIVAGAFTLGGVILAEWIRDRQARAVARRSLRGQIEAVLAVCVSLEKTRIAVDRRKIEGLGAFERNYREYAVAQPLDEPAMNDFYARLRAVVSGVRMLDRTTEDLDFVNYFKEVQELKTSAANALASLPSKVKSR